MAERHVITALIEKRRELAGRIEHLQDLVRQAVVALDNVEACLRIFDPAIDLGPVRGKPVPPPHQAFKGEVSRVVLSALRTAKAPLTTSQVAERVMAERGLDLRDRRLLALIEKRTGSCLRSYRAKGLVSAEYVAGDRKRAVWMVVA